MTVLKGWKPEHAKTVRELSSRIVAGTDASSPQLRAAAMHTGGLPVYCDLGGCLVLVPQGHVVGFDNNEQTTTVVTDPSWLRVARIAAAEKYEMLSELKPVGDTVCPACEGKGRLFRSKIRCGTCGGSGWIEGTGEKC